MSLKNEIFEGIAAYKALTPDAKDKYYGEMYEDAKRRRKKEEQLDRDEEAEKAAAAARRGPTSIVPQLSSTATPGSPPGIGGVPTVQGPVQGVFTDLPPTFRRGGRVGNVNVRRYADGGTVEGSKEDSRKIDQQVYNNVLPHSPEWPVNRRYWSSKTSDMVGPPRQYAGGGLIDRDPDNPVDDIILAQLSTDPQADLGPYAPRRSGTPVRPPPSPDPDAVARAAAEQAPNTRARQGALAIRPPSAANTGFEGSPVIDPEVEARLAAERQPNQRARQGTEQYGPNLPTEQYGPPVPRPTSSPAPRPTPPSDPDAAARIAAEGAPNMRARQEQYGPNLPTEQYGPPAPRRTPDLSEAIAASGGSEAAISTGPPGPPRGQAQAAQAPAVPSVEGSPVIPQVRSTPAPVGGPVPGASVEGSPQIGGPAGEATSGVGRFLSRDAALEQYKIEQEIRRLEREKLNVTPGALESTYPVERREAAAKAAALDTQIAAKRQELAALRGDGTQQAAAAPGASTDKAPPPPPGAAPAKPGATTPATPNAGTALFGRPDVGETGGEAQALKPTSPYPTKPSPPKGPNTVPVKTAPAQNGPATGGGSTGPGSGQGAQPAPPAGGGAASRPYDQKTAPKGSLGDQSRVSAFDPTKDMYDYRNAQRVTEDYRSRDATAAPTQLQPQDIKATMQGIAQSMPNGPTVTGEGAASRGVYNQFVSAHDQGGRLEPGEAALVGMVGRYKGLLRQGRVQEAAAMAVGIMQAASLEAASRGRYAIDQFKSGDVAGGRQTTVEALSHVPDGRSHKLNADGSVTTTDPRTGQVLNQAQLSGQQWLALAMGLSDGSMLWQALQGTIAATKTPDKDATGRALRNTLLEEQIIGARQRNAAGVRGRAGKPAPTGDPRVDALLGEYAPKVEAPAAQAAGTPNYLSTDYTPNEPRET